MTISWKICSNRYVTCALKKRYSTYLHIKLLVKLLYFYWFFSWKYYYLFLNLIMSWHFEKNYLKWTRVLMIIVYYSFWFLFAFRMTVEIWQSEILFSISKIMLFLYHIKIINNYRKHKLNFCSSFIF